VYILPGAHAVNLRTGFATAAGGCYVGLPGACPLAREEVEMTSIVRHQQGPTLSRAVEFGNLVFIAGTTADNKKGSCREQTAEVLKKIDAVMAGAGTSKNRILSANVWVADMKEKEQMDAAWKEWIPADQKPARATVEARLGSPDTRVEIMMVCAKA
jgi:enamine deaminase RidA (YjgF/YER057c/UK114 family)